MTSTGSPTSTRSGSCSTRCSSGDVPFHGENQVAVAMKHVREDLPDVQVVRPEVSARLAAVLDRMTEKDLSLRHPDAASVELDLEDALAAEASRTGTATGEATAVLRTLPANTRRRLPLRLRMRVPVLLLIVMVAVAGAVLYLLLDQAAERTQKGTGTGVTKAPPGEQIVSVKRTSANDYDPLGDDKEEHPDQAPLAVDQDSDTKWTTEGYLNNTLNKPTDVDPGVGLYVDAEPSVNARSLEIQTPEPGWSMEIYGARARAARELAQRRLDAARRGRGQQAQAELQARHGRAATTATTSSGSPRCRPRRTRSGSAR